MIMTEIVRRLGRSDAKLIGRDRFLIFMFGFAAYIAIVLRFLLPWLNTYLMEQGVMPGGLIPISLEDMYPMLVSYMAVNTGAMLVGTIVGFLFLDEKDHHTLQAMLVTPVPLERYISYRLLATGALSVLLVFGMMLVIGQALVPLPQLLLIALGSGFTGPIFVLFLATFAEDKVQGFAYMKFAGFTGVALMVGFFLPEPWQWLIGIYPPFWISKAYWMILEGQGLWWVAWLLGVVLQLGLIIGLARRFKKVAYRV